MVSKEVFDALSEKYGHVSSWGLWMNPDKVEGVIDWSTTSNVGDMTVFDDPDILSQLNPNVVFIGINASVHPEREDGYDGSWTNFHSEYSSGKDYKIRLAMRDTKYYGAYMTDLIKEYPELNSEVLIKDVKKNPEILQKNIAILRDELSILNSERKPLLVAFGRYVEGELKRYLGDEYTIVYVPHFSHFVELESYRKDMIEIVTKHMV